jgi:hypothetical protein
MKVKIHQIPVPSSSLSRSEAKRLVFFDEMTFFSNVHVKTYM